MFLKTLKIAIFVCKKSKVNYLSFVEFSSCQDEKQIMNKRWVHCDIPICCRRAVKNYNGLVNFHRDLKFVKFGFRILFFSFRIFSHYSTESSAELACQLKWHFLSRPSDSMRHTVFTRISAAPPMLSPLI